MGSVMQFWSLVELTETCWIWQGAPSNWGYGRFTLDGKKQLAHRIAWALEYGPIPSGMSVLHHCDVRLCVRPSHLFLGTRKDNMDDKVAKGRQSKGEGTGTAKLSAVQIAEIRARYALRRVTADGRAHKGDPNSINAIAADYPGISPYTIADIVGKAKRRWKHID